ncbi:beta strand repeat-containing protein [Acaryochloris marina]|uniref:Filamentous haemagglutinin FhaB/tRNA nuclease CdiA-like TPS domain-containing protein n=1 Tax=Acaryochloris marina (strain MBIC 11017) TaxID=329726 RepID=B0C2L7_ACAM1|nr:S-layer family protein [Acaryochloris marina]ABW30905.1 conserved hypothetical protein [Acaryochloris marina MBIC11017]BDM79646.1 hypothetical protein AM10699_25140 [Acaryochloris marina MBIC10699]
MPWGCLCHAQVVSDNTLTIPTVVSTSDAQNFIVSGGVIVNQKNIFHSFRNFSIPKNGSVIFKNLSVENIISRVTGSNPSYIDGLITANANLFLVNPKGIFFGQGSQLNIDGSFVASTANQINFEDGHFFSTHTNEAPILTMSMPTGLQLGKDASSIGITGDFLDPFLSVQPGKSLVLIGNGLFLQGGALAAPSGRIELASVDDFSVVGLKKASEGFTLNFDPVKNFQIIRLSKGAFIDTSDFFAGPIRIYGKDISLVDRSAITAFNFIDDLPGASINVQATESFKLSNQSSISVGDGNNGKISISAKRLSLSDFSIIDASTIFLGTKGSIIIRASEYVLIDKGSAISAFTTGNDAGEISIHTGQLILRDGGQIDSTTFFGAKGNAGNLLIEATESIDIFGQITTSNGLTFVSNLFVGTAGSGTTGNGGNINLKTKRLSVTNSGTISVASLRGSLGQAGTLSIDASDYVLIDGQDTVISAESSSPLPAGDITINTGSFRIQNGATISASTTGPGTAGTIQIKSGSFSASGPSSGVFTTTTSSGAGGDIIIDTQLFKLFDRAVIDARTTDSGIGGNIFVQANLLEISSGGQLVTTTSGPSAAGNISLQVLDSIVLEGRDSGLFANTDPGSNGPGGNIFVDPPIVIIRDNAGIRVDSQGTGPGGNIDLLAGNLTLQNGGFISAETTSGQGGNIGLRISDVLQLQNQSRISATAGRNGEIGDGGNINIFAQFIVANPFENNDITANAFTGTGGNISIQTEAIFGFQVVDDLTPFSDISASSQLGLSGTVSIDTPETDPTEGLVDLPAAVVDPSSLVSQACIGHSGELASEISEFTVTGRGGVPANPTETLRQNSTLTEWIAPEGQNTSATKPSSRVETSQVTDSPHLIIEAQGWKTNKQGQLVLTAEPQPPLAHIAGLTQARCPKT